MSADNEKPMKPETDREYLLEIHREVVQLKALVVPLTLRVEVLERRTDRVVAWAGGAIATLGGLWAVLNWIHP